MGEKGDKGDKGDTGATGMTGVQGIQGIKGDRGLTGTKGATGVGLKGDKGDKGDKGNQGQKGPQGQKGDDGVGLKEKIFTLGQTYNKGDYVFSRPSSSSTKHTMYIAQSTFVAVVYPHLDKNMSRWVEFTAPQGER